MSDDKFIVKKPEESDFESISELMSQDFRLHEVLSTVSGFNKENPEFRKQESRSRLRHQLLDGVSLIAVDKEDGTLAGAAINVIVKKCEVSDHSSRADITVALKAIIKFIEKLEEGHNMFSELNTDSGLELIFLCVKEKYSRQGIGRKLTEETLEMAQRLELKFIQSIATSPKTQHIFESLGFETRGEMKCVDFYMEDGSPGFPFAESSDNSRYMVKIL